MPAFLEATWTGIVIQPRKKKNSPVQDKEEAREVGALALEARPVLSAVQPGTEVAVERSAAKLPRVARGEPDITRYLDSALDGAERAAVLTNRLLAFSRQQPLTPTFVDTNKLVGGMAELLRRSLAR